MPGTAFLGQRILFFSLLPVCVSAFALVFPVTPPSGRAEGTFMDTPVASAPSAPTAGASGQGVVAGASSEAR